MCMCRKYMYIQVMYQAKHTVLLYTMAKFQKKSDFSNATKAGKELSEQLVFRK